MTTPVKTLAHTPTEDETLAALDSELSVDHSGDEQTAGIPFDALTCSYAVFIRDWLPAFYPNYADEIISGMLERQDIYAAEAARAGILPKTAKAAKT